MAEIDDILAKHFSQQSLSAEENKLLAAWKAENDSEYSTLENLLVTAEKQPFVKFDTANGWKTMSKRIANDEKTVFTLKPILKYAIAASIAILIGFTGFQIFTKNIPEFIVFENVGASVKTIELPDGSIVDLARDSKLEYAANFDSKRNLKLEGKAFFDVERNENSPFTVLTAEGKVTVLGTSFLVNTNDHKTTVNVKSGRVALSISQNELILNKNESAWTDGESISEKKTVQSNFLSWKTGIFSFSDTPITTVIMFLESFFGDVIDYRETSTECAFTGSFDNQNIEEIIEAVVLSCNLEFSKENNRFILK